MANQTTLKQTQADVTQANILPLLAQAALQGGGMTDPLMQEYLRALMQDQMEARKKEQQKKERMAMNAVQAAQDQERALAVRQSSCNHRKQDNQSTRLGGQRLSGTGQIALTCGFCEKLFHIPALAGQNSPDISLIPPIDEIGG